MLITEKQAKEMIYATGGKIFGVTFVKKDKSLREMQCRLHVKKHLVHKDDPRPSTTAHIDKYITVFEMCGEDAPKYRNINLETMINLNINGQKHLICHDEEMEFADLEINHDFCSQLRYRPC